MLNNQFKDSQNITQHAESITKTVNCSTNHPTRQFVLDCTNPLHSKLPTYVPERDNFMKPYISVLFRKINSNCKENTYKYPFQNADFKIRKKVTKNIGQEEFKNFLSAKIQQVNRRMLGEQTQQIEPMIKVRKTHRDSHKPPDEKELFLQKKYVCFGKISSVSRVRNKKIVFSP